MNTANEDGRLVGNIPCALVIGIVLLVSIVLAGGIIFYFLAVMKVFHSGFSSEEHYYEYEDWENTVRYARQSSAPEWTPDGSQILFPSGSGIYSIILDGSRPRRVTELAGGAGGLNISPNGSRVAYSTKRDRQRLPYYIETSNLDGSDRRRLTKPASKVIPPGLNEAFPAWSTDGQRIAFARYTYGISQGRGIYILDADGSNQRRVYSFRPDLPDRAAEEGFRWGPVWSPDEEKLAFVVWEKDSSSERRDVLYTVRVNDLAVARVYVTRPGTTVHSDTRYRMDSIISPPAWSSDGKKLAFIRRNFDFVGEEGLKTGAEIKLHTVSPDGTELRTVAEDSADDFDSDFFESLSWSPNGTEILFASSTGIYIASADVGGYRRVARGRHASWSPDGSRIAVAHHEYNGAVHDLSTMAPDGSDVQVLVKGFSQEVMSREEYLREYRDGGG